MSDELPTRLIHHPYVPPEGFEAVQPGVHKASTVFFPDVQALRTNDWKDKSGYTYGLHGTPTSFMLEERLATLEGGRFCVLAPSGLSALTLVDMAFLRQGDELLIPDNAYGPGKAFAAGELAAWGIAHRFYNPMDPADLARCITPATRLVWFEAPGSVSLEFPDLPALAEVVQRANAGRDRPIVRALDNTWGAGIAFNAFELGMDVSMQALTKYPSGGADVLMGSVITRDEALHRQVLLTHMRLGLGVGANDAEAVLRALPSIGLRYRAHDEAARVLARWLQQQPAIAQVLHPALEGAPGHAHWKTLCGAAQGGQGAAAGLFSVMINARYTQQQVDAFCDGLRLFKLGYSWGGPMSLVVPYNIASMRSRPPAHLKPGTLVRFSIGLEAVEDLRRDLQQALEHAFPAG